MLVNGSGVITAPVTSAHLNLAENGLSGPEVAWGNGDIGLGTPAPDRRSAWTARPVTTRTGTGSTGS